jgi:hypothetical protein
MFVHLLQADDGDVVSVEVLDDVATVTEAGVTTAEQSKSRATKNPLSDRAVDFWKTLRNWADAVAQGKVDPAKTTFVFYVAQPHELGPMADSFASAQNSHAARVAFEAARSELWGAPPIYEKRPTVADGLREHLDVVFEAHAAHVPSIIERMRVLVGEGDVIQEARRELNRLILSANVLDDLLRYGLGTLKELVDKHLAGGAPAVVRRSEFKRDLLAWVRKYDRAVLAPLAPEPNLDDIDREQCRTYVRQLEAISCKADDILHAISDFLKAATDRALWAERGDVHESSFTDFQQDLVRQWKARNDRIRIANQERDETDRGQLLYSDCQQYKARLQSMDVPEYFTPGSYHELADALVVGWHPRYHDECGKKDDGDR